MSQTQVKRGKAAVPATLKAAVGESWKAEDSSTGLDSPTTRSTLKAFSTELKELERSGFPAAFQAALLTVSKLPSNTHWKVYLDLADLAKRGNRVTETRVLFALCGFLCPSAHQVWLEHSKLEEECGRLYTSRVLLQTGLSFSPSSDQLAIKLLKTEEKLGNEAGARSLLGVFQTLSIESSWKVLLEGAAFEARCGEIGAARGLYQHLMCVCGHYGAVFLEAIRFEERWGGDIDAALDYCERGIGRNNRYGPLWFAYLRTLERAEQPVCHSKHSLASIKAKRMEVLQSALEALSKELSWKVYLDYAQTLERQGEDCRKYLREAVTSCPENLRWKAWLSGARIELKAGRNQTAALLLAQSLAEVPGKQRALVLLEEAKMHEYLCDYEKAEKTIDTACEEAKQDWKIHLEAIAMDLRALNFPRALEKAKQALQLYSCTGRLWAVLIQLQHASADAISRGVPLQSFVQALQEVPKSGEVWCEGARLRLNPFSAECDLTLAESYLQYAIQFTPQYGDSFIELMRLYYLTSQLHKLKDLKQACINADPNYGTLWLFCRKTSLDSPRDIWKIAKKLVLEDLSTYGVFYFHKTERTDLVTKMWAGLSQVWRVYEGKDILSSEARWRLIYGSELLPV